MGDYDVAQICRNGHLVSQFAASQPATQEKFCARCGAPTLMECEHCATHIRGNYHVPGFIGFDEYDRPAFCHNCGEAYPWTASALAAARKIADELDSLSSDEREALKGTLDDLVRDSAQTSVAVLRFKKYAGKAGGLGAAGLRDVLVGVVTEAARKGIWGP